MALLLTYFLKGCYCGHILLWRNFLLCVHFRSDSQEAGVNALITMRLISPAECLLHNF